MKKNSWYLNLIFWLIFFSIVINWSISFFSEYFQIEEGGLIWFVMGLYLLAPYFLLSVSLLSIFKFAFDRLVKKYKNNLLPTLLLSALSLIVVSPFFDVLGIMREFYIYDGAHLVLIYPWPFIVLCWLAVVKISTSVLKTGAPKIWTETIFPSILITSLLAILSPFLIIGRQYVTDNGYFCLLSVNQDDKQECLESKFINDAVIDDCYASNKNLETNNCIYRVAVKTGNILTCDLLSGEVKKDDKSLGWNYSEKEMCLSAIAFRAGEKSKCDSIENKKYASACKELFDGWTREEKERKETTTFIGRMLEKMK